MKYLKKSSYYFVNLLINIFRYKGIRKFNFNNFIHENPEMLDNDLLISSICYEGHHLDKITKRDYKPYLGYNKKVRIESLLNEFEKRKLNQIALINWINKVLSNYEIYIKTKQKIIAKVEKVDIPKNPELMINHIMCRSSVRFWQSKLIEKAFIKRIVEAGINGPISCNRQAFKICIIQNKEENIKLGEAKNSSLLKKSPLLLYIAIDERLYKENYASVLDCGSFCANALIAARFYGIEGCWIYVGETQNQKKLRRQFGLPIYFYFYSVLLLGYPAEKAIKPSRRNVDSIIIFKKRSNFNED